MLLPLRSFLPRPQQIAWNHLRQLAYIRRSHAKYRRSIARVPPSPVKRSRPQPLQQRYLCVSKQRDLRIRQNEVLLLIEGVDSSPSGLGFSSQLTQRPRAKRCLDIAQQLASLDGIVRANRLRQQRFDLELQQRCAKIVRQVERFPQHSRCLFVTVL